MEQSEASGAVDYVEMTADVVRAYISNNSIRPANLPGLIVQVHAALSGLSAPTATPADAAEKATPSQIKKSITPNALISFIDRKPYKTLRRHLTTHGLTPEEYRARYGLPAEYPLVSASYSAARSALAREFGLGNRRKAAPAAAESMETVAEAPVAPKAKAPRRSGGRKKEPHPIQAASAPEETSGTAE